jgi:serine protease
VEVSLVLKTSRILAAAAAAALLAACSGNGSSIPSASSPNGVAPELRVPMNSPYVMYDGHDHVARLMLTRGAQHDAQRAGTSSNLVWHNGPVQHPPSVYLVFWGNFQSGGDPNGEAARLTAFFGAVGGSSWLGTTTQYSDGSGYITNPTGQLAGTWYDTSTVPKRPTQSNVAAEAVKAAAHFGHNSANTSYFIAMPTGHDPSGFRSSWCAFHSSTGSGSSTVSYTDFPYSTDAGASCGEDSVNSGSAGLLDGVTIVGGHEYAETITDPQPNSGWLDSSGSEIGDKCAWVSLQNTSMGGGSYPTQPLWSNAVSGCVQ